MHGWELNEKRIAKRPTIVSGLTENEVLLIVAARFLQRPELRFDIDTMVFDIYKGEEENTYQPYAVSLKDIILRGEELNNGGGRG